MKRCNDIHDRYSRQRWKFTTKKIASRNFHYICLYKYADTVLDGGTEGLLEYQYLIKQTKYKEAGGISFRNEIGWLFQGIKGRVEGTNTISVINKNEVPQDRFNGVIYRRIWCDYREQKEEKNHTQLMVGGGIIDYPDDYGMLAAGLLMVKLMLSVKQHSVNGQSGVRDTSYEK